MTLLTVKEVSDRLRIEHHTVRKYIKDGRLPALNFGGQYRVEEADLEEFLKRSRTTKQEAKTA